MTRGLVFDPPDDISKLAARIELSKNLTSSDFEVLFGYLFNTWVNLGYCPECIDSVGTQNGPKPDNLRLYDNITILMDYSTGKVFITRHGWVAAILICASLLVGIGILSIMVESITVAPDTLGYISTAARNSKYLHLPPYTSQMSGPERAQQIGHTKVMMQDVKGKADTGKIVLGNVYDGATPLKPGRVYR
jgi:hypothetical protein